MITICVGCGGRGHRCSVCKGPSGPPTRGAKSRPCLCRPAYSVPCGECHGKPVAVSCDRCLADMGAGPGGQPPEFSKVFRLYLQRDQVQLCEKCLTKISNACAVAIDSVLGKSQT